jgi:hypothetical protein
MKLHFTYRAFGLVMRGKRIVGTAIDIEIWK